jgi:hypothetical protein
MENFKKEICVYFCRRNLEGNTGISLNMLPISLGDMQKECGEFLERKVRRVSKGQTLA